MLGIAGIIVVTIIIALMEVPYLIKKKLRREMWVFSLLLLVAVGIGIAQSLQQSIPSPLNGLTILFKPLSEAVDRWLK